MKGLLLLALVSSPAAAQTTDCSVFMGQIHCNTQQPNTSLQTMMQGMLATPSRMGNDGRSSERRAAAYSQVGQLIAQGRCDDAKRLARFYNHPDIIADTNKACM